VWRDWQIILMQKFVHTCFRLSWGRGKTDCDLICQVYKIVDFSSIQDGKTSWWSTYLFIVLKFLLTLVDAASETLYIHQFT
jgi:hypothetical protein